MTPSSDDRDPIPQVYALSGPLLTLAAFVPLMPNGRSYWGWTLDLWAEFGWAAAAWILGASTPFLLGVAMSVASVGAYTVNTELCRRAQLAVSSVVCMLISHAVVFSAQLWWNDIGVGSGEFLLVTLVVGLALVVGQGRTRAAAAPAEVFDEPMLWFAGQSRVYARWGCLVVAAACGWARLQVLGGVVFCWGVEVLLVGAVLTVWALSGPRVREDQK